MVYDLVEMENVSALYASFAPYIALSCWNELCEPLTLNYKLVFWRIGFPVRNMYIWKVLPAKKKKKESL